MEIIIIHNTFRRPGYSARNRQNINLRIGSLLQSVGEVFPWCRPLENLSLQFASMASDHHRRNTGGPSKWIRTKIILQLLKTNL